ncbi:MAG: RelA/SpoT domain-containing protein [Candidatus Symbiothrix sp.]|jgi:ppGpp synthetase/RelA/SpoT-type nucleotidyltranferase|nr:RelA/SpoT domain-containing protein [Candidatus Symbiothrix sp.]
MSTKDIESVIAFYNNADNQARLKSFQSAVLAFFTNHYELNKVSFPIIHSVKTRLKDPEHLKDKIIRKLGEDKIITTENLFKEVTDLIGVRILHLHQEQFSTIHESILNHINQGDWALVEDPKAYTWDPEYKLLYENLGIKTEQKETYYTSVHYVVKPNNTNPNPICCEIQVRTLFEEIWGEIDHTINYPHPTESIACKEQLRVLAKLVSTGTRLADSIFRSNKEHIEKQSQLEK